MWDTNWHNVVIEYKRGVFHSFIDGNLGPDSGIPSFNPTSLTTTGAVNWCLGARPSNNAISWSGQLRNLVISNYAPGSHWAWNYGNCYDVPAFVPPSAGGGCPLGTTCSTAGDHEGRYEAYNSFTNYEAAETWCLAQSSSNCKSIYYVPYGSGNNIVHYWQPRIHCCDYAAATAGFSCVGCGTTPPSCNGCDTYDENVHSTGTCGTSTHDISLHRPVESFFVAFPPPPPVAPPPSPSAPRVCSPVAGPDERVENCLDNDVSDTNALCRSVVDSTDTFMDVNFLGEMQVTGFTIEGADAMFMDFWRSR